MSDRGFPPNDSPLLARAKKVKLPSAVKITGIYLIVGSLWIFFSDRLLMVLINQQADMVTRLQTLKGWFYIVATALMLFGLIQRETRLSRHANRRLKATLTELLETRRALQDSQDQFKAFMDYSPLAAWISDLNGRMEYVSQPFHRMFQVAQNPVGQTVFDLFPHAMAQGYLDNTRTVARTGQDLQAIEPGLRTDGRAGEFLVYKFPLPQPDGTLHVGGVALDVTEWKQAESALRASEEQLRLAFEFAQIGSWDWNLQTQHFTWNPNHFRLLGLDPETTTANYDNWRDRIHPEDLGVIETAVNQALATRKTFQEEYRVIYPDGSIHWLIGKGRAVYDDDGRPMRMLGVVLDITTRKQTEERLRSSEHQFRQAIVNAPYPLILHAEDGEVVQINHVWTELTGYDLSDIPTIADWTEKAYGHRMETVRAAIDRLYALNCRVAEGEFTPRTKDGQERIWDFSSAPIGRLPDGRRLVLSMATDITRRKQAETQLRAALAEKDVLLKEIHHRVKNNLQIVSGLLQLQAQGLSDPKVVNALRESQNRIESMSLIHKKLYTSADFGQIDAADYIHSLAVSLLTTYQISPGTVTLQVDAEPVVLSIDQAIPCGLIVNELVSNALKYAFSDIQSGEIKIKLCQVEDQIKLIIKDNGLGLPGHVTCQNTQSLGLSLVHALATEQLDGSLTVDRGHGTQFTIQFPQ